MGKRKSLCFPHFLSHLFSLFLPFLFFSFSFLFSFFSISLFVFLSPFLPFPFLQEANAKEDALAVDATVGVKTEMRRARDRSKTAIMSAIAVRESYFRHVDFWKWYLSLIGRVEGKVALSVFETELRGDGKEGKRVSVGGSLSLLRFSFSLLLCLLSCFLSFFLSLLSFFLSFLLTFFLSFFLACLHAFFLSFFLSFSSPLPCLIHLSD